MKFATPNSTLQLHKQLITVYNNKILAVSTDTKGYHIYQLNNKTWSLYCSFPDPNTISVVGNLAAFVYKNQLFVFQLVQYVHVRTPPDDAGTRINIFDLETKTWKKGWDTRCIHSEGCSFVLYKDRVVMFGGNGDFLKKTRDTFSMSLEPPYKLSKLQCFGNFPPYMSYHSAVVHGDSMFVFPPDNEKYSRVKVGIWKLNLRNNCWSLIWKRFPFDDVREFTWMHSWKDSIIFLRDGKVIEYNMLTRVCYTYSGEVDYGEVGNQYTIACIMNDTLMIFTKDIRNKKRFLNGCWFEVTLGELTKLKITSAFSDVNFFCHT